MSVYFGLKYLLYMFCMFYYGELTCPCTKGTFEDVPVFPKICEHYVVEITHVKFVHYCALNSHRVM